MKCSIPLLVSVNHKKKYILCNCIKNQGIAKPNQLIVTIQHERNCKHLKWTTNIKTSSLEIVVIFKNLCSGPNNLTICIKEIEECGFWVFITTWVHFTNTMPLALGMQVYPHIYNNKMKFFLLAFLTRIYWIVAFCQYDQLVILDKLFWARRMWLSVNVDMSMSIVPKRFPIDCISYIYTSAGFLHMNMLT